MNDLFTAIALWLNNNPQGNGKYQQLLSWKDGTWPSDLTSGLTVPAEVDDMCVHETDKAGSYGFMIVADQAANPDETFDRWVYVFNVEGMTSDTDWVTVDPTLN